MAKTLAAGTILYVEDPATPGDYIRVGNLTSIPVPGPDKPQVNATDFDSEAEEYVPGLPDYGSHDFNGNFNAEDAGQLILFDDAQDAEAPARNFRLDFTRQDMRFTFSAYVTRFRPSAPSAGELYRFESTLRMNGVTARETPIPPAV